MTDEINEGTDEGSSNEPKWWVDEGVPGSGDRPAWLGEKFKSAADLAKSYTDLEKRVGVAPDSYDFSKSQYIDGDYVPFQELQELAKQKRVPSEVMDKMLDSVDKYFNEFAPDYAAEQAKLGDNAKEKLKTLDNWAKANLSPESFSALTNSLTNADSINALDELRTKFMSETSKVPNGNEGSSTASSLEDLRSELSNNLDKYKSDPKYRNEYAQKLSRLEGATEFVDKNM